MESGRLLLNVPIYLVYAMLSGHSPSLGMGLAVAVAAMVVIIEYVLYVHRAA